MPPIVSGVMPARQFEVNRARSGPVP